MARELQQIENELKNLEDQVKTIAEKLEQAYQDYTELLGETLKQQLIYSVYQICTQEYPQGFLQLSLSQKQQLQQETREITKQAQDQLKLGGEVLKQLEAEPNQHDQEESNSNSILFEQWESFSNSEESHSEETEETKETENTGSNVNNSKGLKQLLDSLNQQANSNNQPFHPDNIMAWVQLQEEAISTVLDNVSTQTNEILRKHGIFPQEFPKEMIDAALQAEGAGSISNRAPGVLHLMLEVERQNQQRKSEGKEVIQLAIVRLRVGELEFSAPTLNTKRRTLRELEQQLQELQQQYQKLSKERAIAQAEHAWRSSWHED